MPLSYSGTLTHDFGDAQTPSPCSPAVVWSSYKYLGGCLVHSDPQEMLSAFGINSASVLLALGTFRLVLAFEEEHVAARIPGNAGPSLPGL